VVALFREISQRVLKCDPASDQYRQLDDILGRMREAETASEAPKEPAAQQGNGADGP
jgi:hypothetical protein